MVNRNAGSGTRILIDGLLGDARPPGYGVQTKSHNAVATAVAQGRADWGVAIDTVAAMYGLGFIPLLEEHYDFVVPSARLGRPAVARFVALLADSEVKEGLRGLGFRV
jgi:putative molybdopterin biosynthesis protein